MSDRPASRTPADRDELLAAVLDDLSRQPAPDIDAAAEAHPDLALELRQLWAAALMANAIARTTLPPAGPRVPSSLPANSIPPSFGDFEVIAELGRGGMGVVWRARQISLNRPVALKMVLRGNLASEADRARFRAEAEAAARLAHPHIVTVHEVAERDGQPYFAMQFIDGPTLAQRLVTGPLPPCDAAELLAKVARAVDHAHRQGIPLRLDRQPRAQRRTQPGQKNATALHLNGLLFGGAGRPDLHARRRLQQAPVEDGAHRFAIDQDDPLVAHADSRLITLQHQWFPGPGEMHL